MKKNKLTEVKINQLEKVRLFFIKDSNKETHSNENKNKLENTNKVCERDMIISLSKNVKFYGDGSNKNIKCGSLYNLFDSFLFDIHLLICYLDKNDNQGITDTLVNIMHRKYINESFFYLPQLW